MVAADLGSTFHTAGLPGAVVNLHLLFQGRVLLFQSIELVLEVLACLQKTQERSPRVFLGHLSTCEPSMSV